MTVLCPSSVWQKARTYGGEHNYVQFNRYTEWTEAGFRFKAVGAEHSDVFAIGVVIWDLEEKKLYYVTGDTLYNGEILKELPEGIDVIFLPVNGVGNNMNAADAERFAASCGAKKAVPYHIGMFDELTHDIFKAENKEALEIYKGKEM
jgi:L-ascorbate metabolism protein UlaG (beta-lactamase superfamily)